MMNLLQRYFVKNEAKIIAIRRLPEWGRRPRFMPVRGGNWGGVYIGRWFITWRMPYSQVWAFDETHGRWVPAYELAGATTND